MHVLFYIQFLFVALRTNILASQQLITITQVVFQSSYEELKTNYFLTIT